MSLINCNLILLFLLLCIILSTIQCKQLAKDYESINRIKTSERRLSKLVQYIKSEQWPFMVAIVNKHHGVNQFVCSGVVLTNLLILTAAHCCLVVPPENIRSLFVVLGTKPIRSPEFTIEVKSISIHPSYINKTMSTGDMAIIELMHIIPHNLFHPVKLFHRVYHKGFINSYNIKPYVYSESCLVLGYGSHIKKPQDIKLTQVKMPLLDSDEKFCRASRSKHFFDRFCSSNDPEYLKDKSPFETKTNGDTSGAYICPVRLSGYFPEIKSFQKEDYALVAMITDYVPYPSSNNENYVNHRIMSNILYFGDWINMLMFHYEPVPDDMLKDIYHQKTRSKNG